MQFTGRRRNFAPRQAFRLRPSKRIRNWYGGGYSAFRKFYRRPQVLRQEMKNENDEWTGIELGLFDAALVQHITTISLGDTVASRDGRQINLRYLRIPLYFTLLNPSGGGVSGADLIGLETIKARVMIIQLTNKQSLVGTDVPDVEDLLTAPQQTAVAGETWSMLATYKPKKINTNDNPREFDFKVLYDRVFELGHSIQKTTFQGIISLKNLGVITFVGDGSGVDNVVNPLLMYIWTNRVQTTLTYGLVVNWSKTQYYYDS